MSVNAIPVRLAGLWIGLSLGLALICAPRVNGATIADYHRRVADAADLLGKLAKTSNAENGSQREQQIAGVVARVRQSLPSRETVRTDWSSADVDNTWLHEALNDYEKMDHTGKPGAQALTRVQERLRALDERLTELEAAETAGAPSKDDNKARLAEILRRPDYNQKVQEGSALQRIWTSFIRWLSRLLARLFPEVKPLQPGSARALSGIAQIVVVAIALAMITFVAWKLLPRYLRSRSKKKPAKREARIVLGERLEPDQTSADLLAQADALARSGDLRAAIRKAYIALLCELGDRKLISLAQHKTNRDYLNAVRETNLYSLLRPLTVSFENHWYGFSPATAEDWSGFRTAYEKTLRRPV